MYIHLCRKNLLHKPRGESPQVTGVMLVESSAGVIRALPLRTLQSIQLSVEPILDRVSRDSQLVRRMAAVGREFRAGGRGVGNATVLLDTLDGGQDSGFDGIVGAKGLSSTEVDVLETGNQGRVDTVGRRHCE